MPLPGPRRAVLPRRRPTIRQAETTRGTASEPIRRLAERARAGASIAQVHPSRPGAIRASHRHRPVARVLRGAAPLRPLIRTRRGYRPASSLSLGCSDPRSASPAALFATSLTRVRAYSLSRAPRYDSLPLVRPVFRSRKNPRTHGTRPLCRTSHVCRSRLRPFHRHPRIGSRLSRSAQIVTASEGCRERARAAEKSAAPLAQRRSLHTASPPNLGREGPLCSPALSFP